MSKTLDRDNPTATVAAPADAFRFEASPLRFAAAGEEQQQSKPVELTARTGDPIDHWYWGRVVHDMTGMTSKPVVALDWMHDPDDLVGKADRFDIASGDLVVGGSIESLEVGDHADQIIKWSARGIPLEASIYFDPWAMQCEYLPDGMSTEVNGRMVDGPCVIVREWTLRRIAICPSGADSGTEARFSAEQQSAAQFTINWSGETPMGKTTPATPAATPAATSATATGPEAAPVKSDATVLAAPVAAPETQVTSTGNPAKTEFETRFERFTTEFGAEAGTEYLKAGFTYEAALKADLEKTKLSLKAANDATTAAQAKLAAVNLGEESAVDVGVSSGEQAGGKHTFASCFTAAQGKSQAKKK